MKKASYVIGPLVVVFAVVCVVFPGKRTNPPVERQISWDSPETKATFYRSCADCHSNATTWPWYAHIGPSSWLVIGHVNEARERFNISAADIGHADDAEEEVESGGMPLWDYLLLHSEARLSADERQRFAAGLKATFGGMKEEE